MNTNTVISLPVSADLSAYSDVAVKLTSTGLALAGPTDRSIGTLLIGNDAPQAGQTVGSAFGVGTVFLSAGNGIHFVTIGNSGAWVMGDELEQWPSGRFSTIGGVLTGTGSDTGDTVNITNHGFTNGQQVRFTVLTTGAGLSTGLNYFVVGAAANTFQVSLTSGGAAVAITTDYTVISVRPSYVSSAAGVATDSAPAASSGGVTRAILYAATRGGGGVEVIQAARTLTAADSGKTFILALVGGFTVTLPANTTLGFTCKFRVGISPTTAYVIAAATADTIYGYVLSSSGAAEDTAGVGDPGDFLNFVASTAVIGDTADVFIDGTFVQVKGECAAAGGITITG